MAGLGRNFNTLWAAATVSNVGDGIAAAAAPLLVASLTTDPVLVGMAMFAQQLPWLLFSLISGVVVDRIDRRRLIVAMNATRAVLVGALALAVYAEAVSIPLVYAVGFLLGCCETLGDNASAAMIPTVVAPEDLPRANARLQSAFYVVNKFAAPPLGAALFGIAAGLPIGVNAVSFALAALLMSALRGVGRERPAPAAERGSVRADIADGVRWLWHQPAIRTLSLVLCLMNVTLFSCFSTLVLYCREHLGVSELGYGVMLTVSAAGGLAGSLVAPWLQARFSTSTLLRAGLVVESLTHVGLALAGTAWVAAAVLLAFGAHASVWNSVDATLRQRAVPDELRGRVTSVFMTVVVGGAAVGAAIGGPLAARLGITGPYWVAATVMGALTVLVWRPFGRRMAVPEPVAVSAAPAPVVGAV
ncbi:MFS transporter [Kitasatospora camelliae]|uniref:MFS transporter n=1 Tax=Kitasatospora camelliae TaxID=3156397 RepID=A0AAU8K4R6_9ACTN